MQKIDLKREQKELYNPSTKVVSLVDVPPMNFLMVDGSGDPNHAREYVEAIEALYAVSYALKFKIKQNKAIDFATGVLDRLGGGYRCGALPRLYSGDIRWPGRLRLLL